MQFDWWTLALQTINFAILVWLLHRFLYKPVLRMVDARREEIDKQFAAAAQTDADAKARLAEIATEREGIAAERTTALKAAAAEAEQAAATRRDQAQREADAMLDDARRTMAAEREQALAAAQMASLELGVDVAHRLIGEVPMELRANAWLERVEHHLDALEPEQRDELKHGLDAETPVRVTTAEPLSEPTRTEWERRLRRTLGDDVAFAFEVDESLIAGTELQLPNAILRFSWRNVVASMRTEIQAHEANNHH